MTSPDDLYDEDEEWLEAEKLHDAYYLGLCSHEGLLLSSISFPAFMLHTASDIWTYLAMYAGISPDRIRGTRGQIRLLQLKVDHDQVYHTVDKTRWIVCVQRRWRERRRRWKRKCESGWMVRQLMNRETRCIKSFQTGETLSKNF